MSARPRIWMTGIGAATPLGCDLKAIGDRLFAGESPVAEVADFDVSQHPCRFAVRTKEIPAPPNWSAGAFRALPPTERSAQWCYAEALRHAGLWDERRKRRVALVLGVGAEWQQAWEDDFLRGGDRLYHAAKDQRSMVGGVREALGLSGPTETVSAACASANYALMVGRRWLQLGWADVVLAGGCDMAVSSMSLAAFGNLRALSRRNDAPQAASRPFDRGRDGFVMGEGGVVFALERADDAKKRGAEPWAEVAGVGAKSDAFHMVIPSPDPAPAAAAIRLACVDAGIDPSDIDYVNCHATSTPVGDIAEAKALNIVLGEAVKRVPVSSTKSMTGHLLTAAAAFEALACVLALERQAVPPTINLDDPDPECPLRHVPWQAQEHRLRIAASNSFGFGGSNTCLILRQAA